MGDFWRMIWEQNCTLIIMITNVVENGRKKCDQYWPAHMDTPECYGQAGEYQVQLLSEQARAFYVRRVLAVRHTRGALTKGGNTERLVQHYHYTHWPDHGVPASALPVLTFMRHSAHEAHTCAPVVVHCRCVRV